MDDILYLVIFLFLLIVLPMMGFFVIRRVFSIFRFIPYLMREVIVPHWQKDMESAANGNNEIGEDGIIRYKKTVLTPDELDILRNSFLTKQVHVNPKKFAKKNKRKFAILGVILGSAILGIVLYRIYWVVYDFIVLTYF